jgi:hypothetical protein
VNVLIDENLPPRLAKTLDGFIGEDGHRAYSLREKYGPGVADETWITDLHRDSNDWIVISGDFRITRDRASRMVFRSSGLRGFFLAAGWRRSLKLHEKAGLLLMRWPEIEQQALLVAGGACFEVPLRRSAKLRALPL